MVAAIGHRIHMFPLLAVGIARVRPFWNFTSGVMDLFVIKLGLRNREFGRYPGAVGAKSENLCSCRSNLQLGRR
jgi:hypothetical protein